MPNTITTTNIIGLTQTADDTKIMVNTAHIITFQHVTHDGQRATEIFLTGGRLLWVREDMYRIAEMIDQ